LRVVADDKSVWRALTGAGVRPLVVFFNTINTITITRNIMTGVLFILYYYQNLFKKSTDGSPVGGGGPDGCGVPGLGVPGLGVPEGLALEQLLPKGHAILVK
jgi:hypothetical protein